MGYDCQSYCDHCHASNYQSYGTLYCEDYREAVILAKQKETRTHPPTEAAWERARQVLTKEEWELMELHKRCGREYREKDIIKV